jgi:hypothetical protein
MYKAANRFMQRQAAKDEKKKPGRATLTKRERQRRSQSGQLGGTAT